VAFVDGAPLVIVVVIDSSRRYLESYAQVPQSALASNQYPEVRLDMDTSLSGQNTAHIPGLPDSRTPGAHRIAQRGHRTTADVEIAYQSLYEDKVNPFADFNRSGPFVGFVSSQATY
jgi:hypothetical protein